MARIDIQRDHTLGLAQARSQVDALAERLRSKLEVQTRWEGDVLHFSRGGVDGHISVEARSVRVQARLGLMMAALKPMLEAEIQRRLDEHLD
jgi:putative polyhydroxyalkanoate system protein